MAPPQKKRLTCGIPGLDEITGGGLLENRTYLLLGRAGTGKTILSLQWLLHGRSLGEAGLYITLAEPGGDIAHNIASFGWDLEGVPLLDLTPTGDFEEASDYQVFPASEVEQIPYWRRICEAIQEHRPRRVVIDSLTQLRYLSADEFQFRKNLMGLVAFVNRSGATALVVFEPTELERDTAAALAVDGILSMRQEISPARFVALRSMQVEKLRGTDFMSGWHPYLISNRGIEIFPHRLEVMGASSPATHQIATGLPRLDELLHGGLESGTSTFLSGPTGVGKSTLTAQVLTNAAHQGRRSILFCFEESVESLMVRCRGLGIDAESVCRDGRLRIERVNTMELYPDQFLGMVRRIVEEEDRKVLAIDSIKGYQLSMEEFGSPLVHIYNLITYMGRQNGTTILTHELEPTEHPLKVSDIGVSHMADNILLMRYAEQGGRITKLIGCLKKRLGNFQPEFRQVELHGPPHGIQIGARLARLPGILTASSVNVPEDDPTHGSA